MSGQLPQRQSSAPLKRSMPTPGQTGTPGLKTKQPGALQRMLRRVKSALGIRVASRVIPADCAVLHSTPSEPVVATPASPLHALEAGASMAKSAPALDTMLSSCGASSLGSPASPVEVPSVLSFPAPSTAACDSYRSSTPTRSSPLRPREEVAAAQAENRPGTGRSSQRVDSVRGGLDAAEAPPSPSNARVSKLEYPEFYEELRAAFGAEVVAELKSDKWTDRQAMLKRLAVSFASGGAADACSLKTSDDRVKVTRVVCGLVRACLDDKVAPVVFGGFELWWAFVTSDACVEPCGDSLTALTSVIPGMLHKMCEKNARTAREAMKCVLALARNRPVNGFDVVGPMLIEVRSVHVYSGCAVNLRYVPLLWRE